MGNVGIYEDELLLMQEESRRRHRGRSRKRRPCTQKMPYKKRKLKVTMADIEAQSFPEKEALAVYEKLQEKIKRKQKKEVVIMPDLMAEMLKTGPTVTIKPDQETIIEIPKEEMAPIPAPKMKENRICRPIQRVPVIEDERPKTFTRAPGVYTNIPSPYGIWSEMAADQLKKHG